LLLVLALLQASGICEVVRRTTCEQECRRNGELDCTPDRDLPQCSCHCAGASTIAASSPTCVTVAPATCTAPLAFARADRRPSNPDPREIQHVPRPRGV